MDRLNNFDQDSGSSGRAAAYSLQFDPHLMNQKNQEADSTNPNFYQTIDDHLYDEIKQKAESSGEFGSFQSMSLGCCHFLPLHMHPKGLKLNNYENNESSLCKSSLTPRPELKKKHWNQNFN